MPEFLLELCCEEIPARMQARASADLARLVIKGIIDSGLTYEGLESYVTPRRLALFVSGIPFKTPDRCEERKGPRVSSPPAAIAGFLKNTGLSRIDQAQIVHDGKKGDFYVARIDSYGSETAIILADMIPRIIREFPWQKSMRWGVGSLRWVRPLHSILCLFGQSSSCMKVVPFEIDGIVSSDVTYGHRFMADTQPIRIENFSDYVAQLAKAYVVLDPLRRREIITNESRTLSFAHGMELVEDSALLDEVTGLVEWPVVLLGKFDANFLNMPPEVIRATIRNNQKCFVLRDASGMLSSYFLLVSNMAAKDSGTMIIAGNERVIAARLADARFFYEQDLQVRLEDELYRLRDIIFHEQIGTQYERVERIVHKAEGIAAKIGADQAMAVRAAWLSKVDLVTKMVGEFPELQGIMGRCYALAQGEADPVAQAIEDHYKPQGLLDHIPTAPVSITVALADKLNTLVEFWSISEIPTGSKDPYALRRAALGVIRILLDNRVTLPLFPEIDGNEDLLFFFLERLKIYMRDRGTRHDFLDAVFAVQGEDDLLRIYRRIEALESFVNTSAGSDLLARFKRVSNILRIEEKKDGTISGDILNYAYFEVQAERDLASALDLNADAISHYLQQDDFLSVMHLLSSLCPVIDAFFEQVTININQAKLRSNRLALLVRIREMVMQVADFSRIKE